MRERLKELLNNAYAPYSGFCVASILKMKDGKEIMGVNVENASYGASICSERNAITTAITMGYRKGDFDSIYIMVSGNKLSTPCFVCRQFISEFFDDDGKIVLMGLNGEERVFTVSQLCPYSFSDDDLK